MEVIHEDPPIQRVVSQTVPLPPSDEVKMISEISAKFQELERERLKQANVIPPLSRNVPESIQEDLITKRNAAMMLLNYLGQKKQAILLSILGAVGVFLVTAFAGWIGGVLAVVAVCIWFGSQFLSNEKEVKALKERFVI